MSTLDDRLCLNQEEVAAKVLDGEAIIINLTSGQYYRMDKVGAEIWQMIEARHSVEELILSIFGRYNVSLEQVRVDVERLTAELVEENLVTVANDGMPLSEIRDVKQRKDKSTYESPNLKKYSDMADLLALDPPMPGLQNIAWKDPDDNAND